MSDYITSLASLIGHRPTKRKISSRRFPSQQVSFQAVPLVNIHQPTPCLLLSIARAFARMIEPLKKLAWGGYVRLERTLSVSVVVTFVEEGVDVGGCCSLSVDVTLSESWRSETLNSGTVLYRQGGTRPRSAGGISGVAS